MGRGGRGDQRGVVLLQAEECPQVPNGSKGASRELDPARVANGWLCCLYSCQLQALLRLQRELHCPEKAMNW